MAAEKAPLHEFDDGEVLRGCLPIEVMALAGVDTLRFGPMKPVGLVDPRTGREAVRGRAASAGQPGRRSLQPRRLPDADEVGRAGARAAADSRPRARGVRAVRHDPPQHLHQRADGAARDVADAARDDLFFAGQISGVEGYVESAASGLIAGRNAAALVARPAALGRRRGRRRSARWRTTCRTRIRGTTSRPTSRSASCRRSAAGGREREEEGGRARLAMSERALADLDERWIGRRRRSVGLSGRHGTDDERQLAGVSRVPPAERERLGPHGARVRQRSVAVPRVSSPAHSAGAAPSCRRRTSITCTSARFSASCTARQLASRRRRASSPRSARSAAISAAKGCRRRSGGAGRHAEARAAPPGAPRRSGDVAAARDAGRLAAARPSRPRHPRAVLRVGSAAERAGRASISRMSTWRAASSGCSGRDARSGSCRSTGPTEAALRAWLADWESLAPALSAERAPRASTAADRGRRQRGCRSS